MRIYREFRIEAAHRLPNAPDGHKCRRLHGHSFRIGVHVEGVPDEQSGWIMDFADIAATVNPLFEQLDHRYLNEITGLESPTSEMLARWIWVRLKPVLPGLAAIHVGETCTSGCRYEGELDRV
ncbi:MAG: 6-carboxytetrahydropterin synthase QueD [Gammaproteobacteria bacterium]|nr:6-carboxytetrahydropterin synthase QueD [Gammaproteobacteria bacterium]